MGYLISNGPGDTIGAPIGGAPFFFGGVFNATSFKTSSEQGPKCPSIPSEGFSDAWEERHPSSDARRLATVSYNRASWRSGLRYAKRGSPARNMLAKSIRANRKRFPRRRR